MKQETLNDFIFSMFIFVNVVTRLMKHINFVAAMTRDVLYFSFFFSHTHFFVRRKIFLNIFFFPCKIVVIVYLYILQH